MKPGLNVICETCGASRGVGCRSVKRPPGMPRGMLPFFKVRKPVKTHRARLERAIAYALKQSAAVRRRLEAP